MIVLRCVHILSALVAASAFPLVWAVAIYPIDKGTVYVGPITLWTGVSVALWAVGSLACAAAVLWTHMRHCDLRRPAWYALVAGECAFVLLVGMCGTVVNRALDGGWAWSWGDLLFAAAGGGLLVALPRSRIFPRHR